MHVFLYTLFFCICYYPLFTLSCWSFSPPTNSLSLCCPVVSCAFYHPLLLLLPRKIACSPRFIFYSYHIRTLTLMETLKHISARRLTRGTTVYLLFCGAVTSPLDLHHSSACHCSCFHVLKDMSKIESFYHMHS